MPSNDGVTVLESFGHQKDPFSCAVCVQSRHYYDLLSDRRMVCIECSVKEDFPKDLHVVLHHREPDLMMNDPEMKGIRDRLVKWELAKGLVKLDELNVPVEVASRLLEICQAEDMDLDVAATTAFRMLISSYDSNPSKGVGTEPVLPERAVAG